MSSRGGEASGAAASGRGRDSAARPRESGVLIRCSVHVCSFGRVGVDQLDGVGCFRANLNISIAETADDFGYRWRSIRSKHTQPPDGVSANIGIRIVEYPYQRRHNHRSPRPVAQRARRRGAHLCSRVAECPKQRWDSQVGVDPKKVNSVGCQLAHAPSLEA